MGHPYGYRFGGPVSQRFVVSTMNLKLKVFLEGNLSLIEAPWQLFTRTNCYPHFPFAIVKMVFAKSPPDRTSTLKTPSDGTFTAMTMSYDYERAIR